MDPLFRSESYPHLELRRTELQENRWKPHPPPPPSRDHADFGLSLRAAARNSIDRFNAQPRPEGINPSLILRVRTTSRVDEEQWRRVGFTVVGAESDKLLLLFASDRELTRFREQVDAYQAGQKSRANQKRPDHSWVQAIDPDGIAPLGPEDRTGILLRQLMESGLDPHVMYRLDVELWYLGTRDQCEGRLQELGQFLQQRGGRVTDSYIRDGLCMARVQIPGRSIPELLTVTSIATVELPPRASYSVAEVAMTGLDNLEDVRPPDPGSPRVCVLDSGIARGHPLLRSAVGETIAVPKTLGDGLDVSGHGSHVAGIALYGDVEAHRRRGQFVQNVWIDAAQLTNANNEFDDEKLLPR